MEKPEANGKMKDSQHKHKRHTGPAAASLAGGKVGDEGLVAQPKTHDHREVQKLMALGVLPGVPIRLLRKFPSYVFQLGYSQFTVDEALARKIQVNWHRK